MGLRFAMKIVNQIARLPIIAKPPKDGDAKPGVENQYNNYVILVRTDQLTEKQNYGNVATQSHGSKVDRQRSPDCQRVYSRDDVGCHPCSF